MDSGSTASYVYDASGERVEKDVGGNYTEYFFDASGEPVGDNNRSGWAEDYFPFQGRHIAHYASGEAYFTHVNNIGTAGQVTDYTGAVVQDLLHYPWGQDWLGAMVAENRFASLRHRDTETSFDPTHYRMYASGQGRWLSPDPVAGCPLHPESFDRYSYAGNNPVNLTDPSGEDFWQCGIGLFYCSIGFGYCVTKTCPNFLGACVDYCMAHFSGNTQVACIFACILTTDACWVGCTYAWLGCVAGMCGF